MFSKKRAGAKISYGDGPVWAIHEESTKVDGSWKHRCGTTLCTSELTIKRLEETKASLRVARIVIPYCPKCELCPTIATVKANGTWDITGWT